MKAHTPSVECSTSRREQFFESNYPLLRKQPPMQWMGRLFLKLTDGWHPRLVDLPTGSGKTDVAVIWVLALAWYGLDTGTRTPVPRRLVWIVNRRVLVQQVFRLADQLQEKLYDAGADSGSLADVRDGLARLSGDGAEIFRVVQLRGQLIDDREWSVAPSAPQLIIGTVDQIGSRLLFQGYGLGKWSRPMQAGLLGVDAWICADEAHLVPAFVLTLRQFRRLTANLGHQTPQALRPLFARLPFWTTELSATPSLPPPNEEFVFRLQPSDEDDPCLKERLLAARTRRVQVAWLPKEAKIEDALGKAAATSTDRAGTVAVFVRTPRAANRIAKELDKQFKGRVLSITGRLRGYERDRLADKPVFQRFQTPSGRDTTCEAKETVFLVGTAAAEVGVDADAAAIVCDFTSLPTLLQRLGRLDRRGCISRHFVAGQCEPPTMTIFAKREETKGDIQRRVLKLAQQLRAEEDEYSPSLLVGTHWNEATAKQKHRHQNEPETDDMEADDAEAPAGKENGIAPQGNGNPYGKDFLVYDAGCHHA